MEQKLLDGSFILGMRSDRGVFLQLRAVERRNATLQHDISFQPQDRFSDPGRDTHVLIANPEELLLRVKR